MSRLTKHIHLALISSSLAVAGCERDEPTCEPVALRQHGLPQDAPPACGPVDGHYYGSGYHGYSHIYSGSHPSYGGSGGHSTIGGSSRGGFGSFGHGVGS